MKISPIAGFTASEAGNGKAQSSIKYNISASGLINHPDKKMYGTDLLLIPHYKQINFCGSGLFVNKKIQSLYRIMG